MRVVKLFGPPGTGKTTSTLAIIEQHIAAGISPRKIAYISFTKQATRVARERAMQRFNLNETDLPYFRTIHSLCLRQIGIRRDRIMTWRHFRELGDILGMQFKGMRSFDDGSDLYGMSLADRVAFLENLSRTKKTELKAEWEAAADPQIEFLELDRYARGLAAYKDQNGLLDFTDMLAEFVKDDGRCAPKLEVLCVDEAQDTSALSWDVIRILMRGTKYVYVAGDDDQCCHSWAGADVKQFLDLEGEIKVLDQSYRVPSAIHLLVQKIGERISKRQPKVWKSKEGAPGTIYWHTAMEDVDLSRGTWLLLARNGYMLKPLEEMCELQGWSFNSVGTSLLDSDSLKAILIWERLRRGEEIDKQETGQMYRFCSHIKKIAPELWAAVNFQASLADLWDGEAPIWHQALDKIPPRERDYFIAVRRKGETLTKRPRIKISTIHSAKGGEAQNVLLLTDISAKTHATLQNDPDAEHRCWYVSVSRASENLHIVLPQTPLFYDLAA